jgi:hypothetical protein
MGQPTSPTTDSLTTRLFSGKPSSEVTTEEKRRLITEVWGAAPKIAQDFPIINWHGPNTNTESVRVGIVGIVTDEVAFCNRPGIDPEELNLPDRHDYAGWAYLLLWDGFGEVPEHVVAAALDLVWGRQYNDIVDT